MKKLGDWQFVVLATTIETDDAILTSCQPHLQLYFSISVRNKTEAKDSVRTGNLTII